ncbi:MAG: hypothetical protein E7617_05170 [Ruminococcaceae bacterium]|nr:hypothetical protein [Oscillospiraceae bacterium]
MKLTKRRITTAIILALLTVYAVISFLPKPQNYKAENPFIRSEGELPMLIAHGGGNKEFPDNTLEAFYNAYSVDKNVMMETDVSITNDGVVILSHDVRIDRKTNAVGAISDWNYSDLMDREIDFGYTNDTEDQVFVEGSERERFRNELGKVVTPLDVTYPEGISPRHSSIFLATTLEELILAFPDNYINVEIKQSGELGIKALKATLDVIEKHDAFDHVVLASFHGKIYSEFQRMVRAGEVPEGFMCSPGIMNIAKYYALSMCSLDTFYRNSTAVFQLPMEEVGVCFATERLVKNAHKHNIAVQYWTIDDEEEMRRLIDLGADGIMTNYPNRLKAVLDSCAK